MKITDITKELKRELAMREKVYPSWIKLMKLTEQEAKHRIDALAEAIKLLSERQKTEDGQTKLF